MKSIELTEEHKTKLLEMCVKLFKKEIYGLTIQDNGFLNYSDTSKTVDYVDRIHWFEFCMTHLINKLEEITNKYYLHGLCSSITLSIINNKNTYKFNHPIDYLYDEFKKLK